MIARQGDRERVATLCEEMISLIHDVEREARGSYAYASKTTAALRRRSMDLTRALADLRRSS